MFGKRKVGIALCGGAARGFAHIGVLQVLNDIGINISAISGCSMGSAIGAVYSLGIDLNEMEEYIRKNEWRNFLFFSFFTLSKNGLINERKVDEVLKKFLGNKTFDDCKIPFCCVAVDILNKKKVVLDSGMLREAVKASIAVPGVFPPIIKNGGILVDGGIVEPLPTECIGILDTNFIIASSIVFDEDSEFARDAKNFILKKNDIARMPIQTIIDKSMTMVQAELTKTYLKKANLIIEPKVGKYGFFDFQHAPEIIEAGRKATRGKIPEIRKKLSIRIPAY